MLFCKKKSFSQRWLQILKVKVAQSCPTLCDPMDYTVHGILQARLLEWVAFFPKNLPKWIFPTQGSNPGLLHCRRILYQLIHKEREWLFWIILVSPHSNHGCLYKREEDGDWIHMEEEAMWALRQRLEWYDHKSKKASSHQKLKEARNRFLALPVCGTAALWTLWFWPSEINFGLLIFPMVKEYISVILGFQVSGNLVWEL